MSIDEFRSHCDSPVVIQMPDEIHQVVQIFTKSNVPPPPKTPKRLVRKRPMPSESRGLRLKVKKVETSQEGVYRPMSPY